MKQTDIAKITAAVIAALGGQGPVVKLAGSKSGVDARTDYRLRRNVMVANGFKRRGVKLVMDKATGRFVDVKPYKTWLSEGRQVRKGEKSVRGFFHVSQTDLAVEQRVVEGADVKVTVLPAQTREHFEAQMAEIPF